MSRKKIIFTALVSLTASLFLDCSYSIEKKYVYAKPYYPHENYFNENNPQFEEGEPYWIVDFLGNVFGSLTKLILWNRKMNSHSFSEETKNYLKAYIRENNLKDVKVRFNQYAPISDLQQLIRSETVHPVLKYTIGIFNWLIGAILPERVFAGLLGGDHYNPYSNTINLYSDLPSVVLHEGGHSKDFALRKYKSLYSLGYTIPFIGPLYPEARASDDALRYIRHKCDLKSELVAYRTLYPAYATYATGPLLSSLNPLIGLVASVPGHVVGYVKEKKVEKQEIPECELLKEMQGETKD
ncbi:hypothetical protein EHQ12_19070 [Leptospira gomenensis]|uniref:Uncharacterized protein n=1 Tax=Leptospira gomenensis TaxID=2484974 RepID=A0A5F1Y8B2_9LEPT|nr:hypothetical protein [Leptospira gomenensis]TGK31506.1 hypothetical protein EHQ17_13925 [Leptospira gomenensis]TGK32496.1 hypothetical protein EHQ12_19070 [Leptospira gomenensis]TGK46211.1 hypothetical protein EHQ07_07160 [Leptospira gomenensis]TGK54736.1 hypothetical protein EHQ13_18750 [Leptospira gomenensis]